MIMTATGPYWDSKFCCSEATLWFDIWHHGHRTLCIVLKTFSETAELIDPKSCMYNYWMILLVDIEK